MRDVGLLKIGEAGGEGGGVGSAGGGRGDGRDVTVLELALLVPFQYANLIELLAVVKVGFASVLNFLALPVNHIHNSPYPTVIP